MRVRQRVTAYLRESTSVPRKNRSEAAMKISIPHGQVEAAAKLGFQIFVAYPPRVAFGTGSQAVLDGLLAAGIAASVATNRQIKDAKHAYFDEKERDPKWVRRQIERAEREFQRFKDGD
jgi:hypothetical protein